MVTSEYRKILLYVIQQSKKSVQVLGENQIGIGLNLVMCIQITKIYLTKNCCSFAKNQNM